MKKMHIDQSKCSMCGACLTEGHLLKELSDGRVEVQGSGILKDDQMQAADALVELCPENALAIEEQAADIDAIKAKIRQPLSLELPEKSRYSFNKEDYNLSPVFGKGEHDYRYTSYSDASHAGLREFRDAIWGQRKAMAQQIIISYKHDKLMAVMQYEEKPGNYKYETIQRLTNLLKSYVDELEAATGKKLDLPGDFYTFKANNSVVLKDILRYRLDGGWAETVADECEPYDWFEPWIDVDDSTRMKVVKHFFGDDTYEDEDVYCYKLSGASKELNTQILNACQECIPEMADQEIESEMRFFHKELQTEWESKIKLLL